MIDQLAKHHDTWIRMAISICGDRDLANDLVQEMYLKLHDSKKQYSEVNEWYIYVTIKNIFVDQIRRNKEDLVDPIEKASGLNGEREPEDTYFIDHFVNISEDEEDAHEKMCNRLQLDQDYVTVKSVFDSLPWHKREVLKNSYIDGLRPFSRESNICVHFISKTRKEFKEKVWEELKRKKPQASATLSPLQRMQLESSLAKVATNEGIFLI